MMNLMKKICKGIVLTIGTLMTLAALVGGSVGIYYKETSVGFYTNLRSSILDTITQINTTLSSTETLIDDIFKNGNDSLKTIQENIKELETKADSINDESTKTQIKEMISKIETSVKTIQDNILNDNNEQTIKDSVNKFVEVANDVSSQIESYAQDITPQKFSETYETVTVSMTTVSATVLGIIIATSIIQFLIYKKVDGVRVRRSKVKSDLVKHVNKILKKYPSVKNSLK